MINYELEGTVATSDGENKTTMTSPHLPVPWKLQQWIISIRCFVLHKLN
jgi:hypothetical protein